MSTILTQRLRGLVLLTLACVVLRPGWAVAQSDLEIDAADTSSPRATLRSFIDACNELHRLVNDQQYLDTSDPHNLATAARVLDCIDTSELPDFAREQRAGEVAVCLKEILDRHQLPAWDAIPDVTTIEAAGGFDRFSRWRIPGTRITIARIEDGPQKHEYLFSTGTVDRAPDYFRDVEARPYRTSGPDISPGLYKWFMSAPRHAFIANAVQWLPDWMRFGRTFGLSNWKWPGLLITFLLALAMMLAIYGMYFSLVKRTYGKSVLAYCLTIVFPLIAMVIPFLFEHVADAYLAIRGDALYVVSFCAFATAILMAIFVVFVTGNRVAEGIIASPRINPLGLNAQLIRIGSKLVSVALAVVVFLIGGQYLGIPVATLLASAGIGGIALALGAQDALKTLFGTLMLMADRPFGVGDRIIFKNYDGVVEDIGLRSTRIRLLTSHQVTVPNDELSRSDIENVARRECIRRVADIRIPLDTPYEKVREALDIVRTELDNHEGMDQDYPPRVFFLDFVPDAFTIRVIYWYHPPNYWDYLAFGEKFNLAIFRAFSEHGIRFSLPQRVAHTSIASEETPIGVRMVSGTDDQSGRETSTVRTS